MRVTCMWMCRSPSQIEFIHIILRFPEHGERRSIVISPSTTTDTLCRMIAGFPHAQGQGSLLSLNAHSMTDTAHFIACPVEMPLLFHHHLALTNGTFGPVQVRHPCATRSGRTEGALVSRSTMTS
jgi:hypothetical protein